MLYESENRQITIAVTGDALITRRMRGYREE